MLLIEAKNMGWGLLVSALLFGACAGAFAGDVHLYLIDSAEQKYLQAPKDGLRVTAGGVSGAIASLLSLPPPSTASTLQLQEVGTTE